MAPINLETPFTVGDIEPGASYSRLKVKSYFVDNDERVFSINAICQKNVDGEWIAGKMPARTYEIRGDDFDALVAANSDLYDAMKAALYSWIQDNDSRTDGVLS